MRKWSGRVRVHAMLLAATILGAHACIATPVPRSLLLVTADDLDAASTSWMGNPFPPTPRIDALAAASHRFVNHHVTVPICQPSRAVLFTGRLPHRNGAVGFGPIRDDVPTLTEILRAHGYFTAAIDKLRHMRPRASFPWHVALHGIGRSPWRLAVEVARCLAAARQRPFFLNVNITDPHRPFRTAAVDARALQVPGFLEDLPPVRREFAHYLASVARLDASLGATLDALAASRRDRDTVVVFLSDNGASFPFAKATVYAHGTWSPLLLRLPDAAPPATHDELVSSVDLMPTLLELLGVPVPAGLDGRSWASLLRGEAQDGRDVVFTEVNTVHSGASYPQRAVRTHARALLFQPWAAGRETFHVEAMRGRTFPALLMAARHDARIAARVRQYVSGVPLALYDLVHDPDERRNVADVPAFAADVEELARRMLEHMLATGDPLVTAFHDAVTRRHEGASIRTGGWQDALPCREAR